MTHATNRTSHDRHHHPRQSGPIVAAVGPTGGESVLRMARALSARDSQPVLVVSVVSSPAVYAIDRSHPMLNTWPMDERRAERLQSVHNRLHEVGQSPPWREEPTVEIVYGNAGTSIADIAHEHDASLLIVGSGPHELRNRLFATETALATMRRVHCPVLVVSGEARSLPEIVVVATDFSPAGVHAAARALPLVADDAVIHLVHAWSRIRTPIAFPGLQELDASYVESLPERFARMRTALGASHTLASTANVGEGAPAQIVLEAARRVSADLIVAGTRGFGMLDRLLVGSVSTALVRGAECSVLIVPGPDAVERARIQRHMTGASTVTAPEEWARELEELARRNQHRRTSLEIDDRAIGAQIQESGYSLTGATYDPHDRAIELMFARPGRGDEHLTRSIANVRNVATTCNGDDVDTALCIETEHGSALLTFLADRHEEVV
ncbi:MAG: universal stress protein [bacterium]